MLALEKYFFIKIVYTLVQFLCVGHMSYLSSVELCKVRQCCACCWHVCILPCKITSVRNCLLYKAWASFRVIIIFLFWIL
jgi:hypothetical protein